jgi:Alpha/beta hydrolase domain
MMRKLIGLLLLAVVCVGHARIVEIKVQSVRPFAEGQVFGPAGAYERVTGTAIGELSPTDTRNRVIVNLDRAAKNARGMVEYEVDFDLLRPVDTKLGNGKIMYDVTNRGRKFLPVWLMAAAPAGANNPLTPADAGDGLFLRMGYTIVWTGWDADAPRTGGGMAIKVPLATTASGGPIVREIRDELVSATRGAPLREFRLAYETATTDTSQMRLTVRRRESDSRVELPHSQWRLKDARTLEILASGNLGTGPEVGSLYEFHYPAKNPSVLGIGYAATRDFISFLRHEERDARGTANPAGGRKSHALAVGISQSGRYVREHIALGFNQDESSRRVFDGMLAHISGVGRVFLNYEFGMAGRTNTEHEDHLFPENEFPFSASMQTDPWSGKTASLFRNDGFDPLLIETNTSTEYWQKGASLLTTDTMGQRDVPLPPNARAYLIASTQHAGRYGLKPDLGPCMNFRNPHNPMPAVRALLVALDQWATVGILPPPSRVPTISAGTLVRPDNQNFPNVPGLALARAGNTLPLFSDWVHPKPDLTRQYRALVSKTDTDGNEVAGIPLPEIAVPLATYTGWNLYMRPFTEGDLCDRDGSYSEFAATQAERVHSGDPRLSIAERYTSHADYAAKLGAAAEALARDRLLLNEDVTAYVRQAQSDTVRRRFGP